jgi:phenylacetic acid degradation operon negative regulatory protein
MRHIERPPVQTQFVILNLFGDYVAMRGRSVQTSGLLEVLGLLGVSERAARSTLSRMKSKGWLYSTREGRRSFYALTPKGTSLLIEGSERLFGPGPTDWDNSWHLVTYSLPGDQGALRHQLRTRLSWLGYGMLEPGTMIAPFSRREQVQALIEELIVGEYVHFFTRAKLEMTDDQAIVSKCWDLEVLNKSYSAFIERHQPEFDQLQDIFLRLGTLPEEQSFIQRFWVIYEYSAFPRKDPNLPDELLPEDWQGRSAAKLLAQFRELLSEPSERFINDRLGLRQSDSSSTEFMEGILVR